MHLDTNRNSCDPRVVYLLIGLSTVSFLAHLAYSLAIRAFLGEVVRLINKFIA